MQDLLHFGIAAVALVFLASGAAPVFARDGDGEPTVSATIALVSDYRFRGVSLSGRGPALQGSVEIARNGWFAGGFASTTAESRRAGSELDFYAGTRGRAAGFDYSFTAYAYLHPSGAQSDYLEVESNLGRKLGPVMFEVQAAYVPRQRRALGTNLYLGATATMPIAASRLSARIHGGFEDGFYDRKLDWEAGISWSRAGTTLTASAIGARGPGRDASYAPGALFTAAQSW